MAIYTPEFKVEAVKLVIDNNLTLLDAVRRRGYADEDIVGLSCPSSPWRYSSNDQHSK
jgi:hypothetical protein